jgi:hypothetical protein
MPTERPPVPTAAQRQAVTAKIIEDVAEAMWEHRVRRDRERFGDLVRDERWADVNPMVRRVLLDEARVVFCTIFGYSEE